MSFIHIPDPHPGRCQNYRNIVHSDGYPETLRCLDYEYGEHVCRFPKATHAPITDRNAIYSQDSTRHALSKPWIAPWDDEVVESMRALERSENPAPQIPTERYRGKQ